MFLSWLSKFKTMKLNLLLGNGIQKNLAMLMDKILVQRKLLNVVDAVDVFARSSMAFSALLWRKQLILLR